MALASIDEGGNAWGMLAVKIRRIGESGAEDDVGGYGGFRLCWWWASAG